MTSWYHQDLPCTLWLAPARWSTRAAVEKIFSPSAWPGRVLPAEHPLAPAATVEAETQPATRTCFPTTEAGTGRLHLRRPPKIANAMRTQILGPKASITAAATGSQHASVSNCDIKLILNVIYNCVAFISFVLKHYELLFGLPSLTLHVWNNPFLVRTTLIVFLLYLIPSFEHAYITKMSPGYSQAILWSIFNLYFARPAYLRY